MQLEETDPAAAVRAAGPALTALHLADTTRHGLGHGALDLPGLLAAARDGGFDGPLVLEFTAPGPDPFTADKGPAAMRVLDPWLRESAAAVAAAVGAPAVG
jgi:D-psicose/D-tagatose/L-ribulose 3-epimerase